MPTDNQEPGSNPAEKTAGERWVEENPKLVGRITAGVIAIGLAAVIAFVIYVAKQPDPFDQGSGEAKEPASQAPAEPSSTPTATAPVVAPIRPSSCTDRAEGESPADITKVSVTVDDDLVVRFDFAKALPERDLQTTLTVDFYSQDEKSGRQLSLRILDGKASAASIFESETGDDIPIAEDAIQLDESSVTVTAPPAFLATFGNRWTWEAETAVSFDEGDSCPDSGSSSMKVAPR